MPMSSDSAVPASPSHAQGPSSNLFAQAQGVENSGSSESQLPGVGKPVGINAGAVPPGPGAVSLRKAAMMNLSPQGVWRTRTIPKGATAAVEAALKPAPVVTGAGQGQGVSFAPGTHSPKSAGSKDGGGFGHYLTGGVMSAIKGMLPEASLHRVTAARDRSLKADMRSIGLLVGSQLCCWQCSSAADFLSNLFLPTNNAWKCTACSKQ